MSVVIGTSFFSLGCSSNSSSLGQSEDGTISQPVGVFNVNAYALNKLSCDPMDPDGDNNPGFQSGLKTELYYLSDDQPRYSKVDDYIANGHKSDQTLFFSQLNVPTRLFDTGFPTETGDLIQNDQGEPLFEYFALKANSVFKLRPDQEEGLYELALLSDDGAVWKIDSNGNMVTYVDNDGNHPSRFGCSTKSISMKQGESHLMELTYYQGPKYHISVIPMMRKINPGEEATDPLCGKQGNSLYFDYNNNSKPKQAYLDLLARGWEPLSQENYELPLSTGFNPCAGTGAPQISQIYVFPNPAVGVTVTWKTDVPSTSQVLYTRSDNGVQVLTVSDNVLRTDHQVTIPYMPSGVSYLVRAVSVSAGFGKTVSGGIHVH